MWKGNSVVATARQPKNNRTSIIIAIRITSRLHQSKTDRKLVLPTAIIPVKWKIAATAEAVAASDLEAPNRRLTNNRATRRPDQAVDGPALVQTSLDPRAVFLQI